jgi:alkylated DNA nucleotide flippase Atl1
MRKSWQDKMQDKDNTPKILKLERNYPCYNAVHKMGAETGDDVVLVNPREVEDQMKLVPEGKVVTLMDICQKLAVKYRVKACCTLTAGIFTMTAANAAEEMKAEGKENSLPYWRTLKSGGELNPKYPGGIDGQSALLEKEGFTIIRKGKKAFVKDYENYLYQY